MLTIFPNSSNEIINTLLETFKIISSAEYARPWEF